MGKFLRVMSWLLGAGVVLALVGGGAALFLVPEIQERISEAKSKGQGEVVRLEEVALGRLVRTISAPGVVEATTKVSLSARISAQIIDLPFDEGDSVRQGDIVVKLDDRDLLAQLASAEASLRAEEARLEGARASYVNAVSEWERQQSLYQSADVSKADLERAEHEKNRSEATLRAAEASIEMAKAGITRVREDLRYTEIASPINGTVTHLNAEEGELVVTGTMNNAGTVILEIADLNEMIVRTEVDETDIAEVRIGQRARVYLNAYSDEVFDGEVKKIALERRRIDQRNQTASSNSTNTDIFEVEVLLDLEGRTIYSGLTASVEIEVETMEGVLLAPSQAVKDVRVDELPDEVTRDNPLLNKDKTFARVVYTLVDGEAVATPVLVGASDLRTTAIKDGVKPGTKIVVGPYKALLSLAHGAKIQDEAVVKAAEEARKNADAVAKSGDADAPKEGEAPAVEEGAEAQAADDAKTDETADDDKKEPDQAQTNGSSDTPS